MSEDDDDDKIKIVEFCQIMINVPILVCSIIMFDDNDVYNIMVEFCQIIINVPILVYSSIMFVFSLVMYIIMIIESDGDTSKTREFLLGYLITQLVCLILNLSAICVASINLCCSYKNMQALLIIVCIVANVIMPFFGIANIVYAILITYEFFAYNYTASYTYLPMLVFVILILISFVLIMMALLMVICLIFVMGWVCMYCMFNEERRQQAKFCIGSFIYKLSLFGADDI